MPCAPTARGVVGGTCTALLIAGLGAAPDARRTEARFSRDDPPLLALSWTIAAELPSTAHRSMVAEVERIWETRVGLDLQWCPGGMDAPSTSPVLRIVILHGHLEPSAESHRYGLAEFRRDDTLVVASVDAARRVVREGLDRPAAGKLPISADHALGLVLGRAVAHEIGHYLLGTGAHVRTGLMRETFAPRDLVDPRAMLDFELDEDSVLHLLAKRDTGALAAGVFPPYSCG